VPTGLAFVIQKILRTDPRRFSQYISKTNPVLMLFILWGSTAAGASYTQENPSQFFWQSLFIAVILLTLFVLTYSFRSRHSRKQAITMGFVSVVRNGALPLVVATTFFSSETLSPIIASMVVQHLFIAVSGTLFRRMQGLSRNSQANTPDTCFQERKTGP
jgi:predicted Na+-dependent transporter